MDAARTANLLGAVALVVDDAQREALQAGEGLDASTAAALVHLHRRPGDRQSGLRAALGLSQPGAAHLVRRLVGTGLVAADPGRDRRSRELRLTDAGVAAVDRALRARGARLEQLVGLLPPSAAATLGAALEDLLERTAADGAPLERTCRLCDVERCERQATCPVVRGRAEHDGRA